MKRLPHDTEQKLLAILRDVIESESKKNNEAAKVLDEDQACWDFAGILERLNLLDQEGHRPGIRRPWGPLRILASEAAQTFHHHTAKVPGRTTKGGPGARFVMLLADAADITDPKTSGPYSLEKCASAVKEAQNALNARAALNALPKFTKGNTGQLCNSEVDAKRNDPARAAARNALLEPHQEGEDDEGWPIIEGYEPAPDRSRTVQDRVPREALNKVIAESKGAPKKPKV